MFRPKSTFEQWRIFQAVVDCGGYAQAAEALNKSQSSLSHAVAKLQQSLGVPLLEVRGRKAVLTPAGEIFLKRARQLSQQVEELENLANNLERQWEPQINLYVSVLQPRERLYRALANFYPRSRGCRVNLHERIHCHFNALQVGDLMLSEHLPQDRTGLPLDEVCLLPLCSAEHPLAALTGAVSTEELASHNQISLHPPIHRSVDWNDVDDTGWKATHYHEAIAMLKLGLGYAWLPRHLVQEELGSGALVPLDLESGNERHLYTYLLTPSADTLGPATELLLRCLRNEYQTDNDK
ncbi:TPA: LysR family transcriptional regulator [Aeromonas salmonicida subsp. salmonicida]|uniref:LysR family transcriptional regulator n=1 Tax=Aeromonas salmonicida TaxID=645 RepID=UPI00132041B0|nr:LysR family transcriptional regulator [Aeromonas salmonicida]ELI6418450.1 LysR family transcriptional regulator [Aeromonas salmonicida subsp. salmonicida]ELM3646819.1 LysR family transcriptional regulator [Aeromonas salmonicida subsp. salmonicida]QHE45304.1 LysR family transcriptional regulator [Aeromonas salmonicida subsp. salmonicida]QHE47109.1 LysR family transcriptional regulator [Aeromonas salmonicida subsp. salmonicida]QJF54870.1 LysR family transcriptional regulator [Aeromonas salmon